jgi:hypothetical protein
MRSEMSADNSELERNRFISLAARCALHDWTSEQARSEIQNLSPASLPSIAEMDHARAEIGNPRIPSNLAAAIDMLFDVGIPGISDDAEHYPGNVNYYLAVGWLHRYERGEQGAADYFWRHCRAAREQYPNGHQAWADVLQLEAIFYCHTASQTDAAGNLRRAIALFEEARPCYLPEDRYWPIRSLEAAALEQLWRVDHDVSHMRFALDLMDEARECFDPGDPAYEDVMDQEVSLWRVIIQNRITPLLDLERFERFLSESLSLSEDDMLEPLKLTPLRNELLMAIDPHRKRAAAAHRLKSLIFRILCD